MWGGSTCNKALASPPLRIFSLDLRHKLRIKDKEVYSLEMAFKKLPKTSQDKLTNYTPVLVFVMWCACTCVQICESLAEGVWRFRGDYQDVGNHRPQEREVD